MLNPAHGLMSSQLTSVSSVSCKKVMQMPSYHESLCSKETACRGGVMLAWMTGSCCLLGHRAQGIYTKKSYSIIECQPSPSLLWCHLLMMGAFFSGGFSLWNDGPPSVLHFLFMWHPLQQQCFLVWASVSMFMIDMWRGFFCTLLHLVWWSLCFIIPVLVCLWHK